MRINTIINIPKHIKEVVIMAITILFMESVKKKKKKEVINQ